MKKLITNGWKIYIWLKSQRRALANAQGQAKIKCRLVKTGIEKLLRTGVLQTLKIKMQLLLGML